MGKPTICIGENKDADQLRGNRSASQIVQFLFYLNPKFQASSSVLCLCRPVCVGPVRKPHCWFCHEAAQILAFVMGWFSGDTLVGKYFTICTNCKYQCHHCYLKLVQILKKCRRTTLSKA